MNKYVILRGSARVRADYEDDVPVLTGQTVYEAEGGAEDTGLLDANGERIGRVLTRAPLGFDLAKVR